MNIDNKNIQQYTSARFDERKKQITKNKYFDCEQKKASAQKLFYKFLYQNLTNSHNQFEYE